MTDLQDATAARDANSRGQQEAPDAEATPLIPPRLAFLVEERPVLWYEDGGEYDSLREEVFAELVPAGAVECILVKNLVDYVWEARRYRRLKTAAIHAEMPTVAARMLAKPEVLFSQEYPDRKIVMRLARAVIAAAEGREDDTLKAHAEREHVTPDVLHYEAHKGAAEMMLSINRECERMERRRDQLLKQIEERRAALGAMARSLLRREAADATAVILDA